MNTMTQNPNLANVEIIRGSKGFANACRFAAVALAMSASAAAMAKVDTAFDRPAVAPTPAALKAVTLLPSQAVTAERITPEQAQTLSYGMYPPVKTTIKANGKTETHWTLHPFDMVRLAREASKKTKEIEGVYVPPEKIGAIMIAESAGVARTGWSANGKTPSFGLGQLELNTAKSLGVKDANDPKETAVAIGRLLAEGMRFANAHKKVKQSYAISLSYNTSSTLRQALVNEHGRSLSMEHLPVATQHHVKNMAYGEGRMTAFAKLSDAHDRQIAADSSKMGSAMYGVNKPTPSPATIVAGYSPSMEQARLVHNQVALEKAGHIQRVPMTERGMADMRLTIGSFNATHDRYAQVSTMSELNAAKTEAIYASQAPAKSTDLTVGNLARSLLLAAQAAVQAVRELAGDKTNVNPPNAPSNKRATVTALQTANQSSKTFLGVSTVDFQRLREQLAGNANAPQDRPA
jgi:hypothetical protein